MILPLNPCHTAYSPSPLKPSSHKQETRPLSEVLEAMRATGLVINQFLCLNIGLQWQGGWLLIFSSWSVMPLPGQWCLWWEVQWCPHGATGLSQDTGKTPAYTEMCTHVSMMQWGHIFGKVCGAFYVDRLKVFLGTLWGLRAPHLHVPGAVSKWPQQSTWVMFASDCSYSCCSTSGAGVEHSTDPVIWVWIVSSLAGSEQLRTTMKVPLQNQPQWFLQKNTETFHCISWKEAYSRDKNVTVCAFRRIRERLSKRIWEFKEAWNALRHWKKALTVISSVRARSSYTI